ncbi:MAG: AAA family ATPase, partial [Treponema sp.]|nr:AAA family ATPase [Treponema sp.]
MKKLPLGMQDFKRIITENYVYVDKTRYIYNLLNGGGDSFFLSRPRRFGKTLTISTLYYLFKGEKELFKNTYIYDKWDFKEYPVIRMSMLGINTENTETVKDGLRRIVGEIYEEYGFTPTTNDYQGMFSVLIKKLSSLGQVVVLIDEYDRPMLNHLGNPEMARAVRGIMREFYITVKDTEPLLKLAFLTGITKISKAGIFSTLNHLIELTTQEKYSTMLGITGDELETCFSEHLEAGVEKLNVSREELVGQIRDYYDGFSFDGEHFVYNPFSILNFFNEYKFKNYWVSSGPPSSLLEY